MEYCCRIFDTLGKGPFPLHLTCLVARTEIKHSVAIMVDTDLNVYHRSRRTGQFCKVGPGGGEEQGSKHYSCREGLKDEFGVDFNNPAVLWVSQPIIEIAAPHENEQRRGKPFSLVWMQYVLIDARKVEKLPIAIELGGNERPAATDDWGHF